MSGARIDQDTKLDAKWRLVWNLLNDRGKVVSLAGADLTGANLRYAVLRGVDLSEADLAGANLTGVDLSQTRGLTRQQLAAAKPPVDSCLSRYRDENAGALIGR